MVLPGEEVSLRWIFLVFCLGKIGFWSNFLVFVGEELGFDGFS